MKKKILMLLLATSMVSAQQIKPFQPATKTVTPAPNAPAPAASAATAKSKSGIKIPFSAAEPEDITNENYPDLIDSFDYPNADITDVIKAISELTGKNFIIDPNVTRGKISIVAPSQITVAEAYKAFLTALATNGLTVIPAGKFLKITQARKAIKDSIETYSGAYAPDSDMMITRIIHVKYISAEELDKRIRILISNDGTMAAYPPTNSLIISDYGSNIDRMVKIIERLDVPGFEEKMEVVSVKFAKAKDIADLVDQILNKDSKRGQRGGTTFTSTVPRFGERPAETTTEAFRVISDDRTNSLIVVGNQAGIAKVTKLIKRLDYKLRPEDAGGVHVYYVKFGDAEAIANTLSGIAQKAKQAATSPIPNPMMPFNPAPVTEPLFGGDVKVQADKATNSLIITASKQDYIVIYNLLRKIDIPRDQIYVEAIIMETNAVKSNAYSASFIKYASDNGIARSGFIGTDPQTVLNPIATGGILGFGSGSVTITNPAFNNGQPTTIPSLLGLITFLKNTTEGNVLSNPQLMALNNEKATIEVGSEVPVSSNVSTAPAGGIQTTNIERKNATIKLVIEPFISPNSDRVRMKVDQKIVDLNNNISFGKATNLAANAVALDTRTIETSVLVRDGDTAVLGGLIKNSESVIEQKVPVLGDIPLLGWLFKSSSSDVRKTNLLVFLTPRIMRAGTSHRDLVEEKLNRRAETIRDYMGGRDPNGREIDRIFKSKRTSKNVPRNDSNDEIIDETLQ